MTTPDALVQMEARHYPYQRLRRATFTDEEGYRRIDHSQPPHPVGEFCRACGQKWPCDARLMLIAIGEQVKMLATCREIREHDLEAQRLIGQAGERRRIANKIRELQALIAHGRYECMTGPSAAVDALDSILAEVEESK